MSQLRQLVIGSFGWSSDKDEDSDAYGFDDRQNRKPVPMDKKFKPISWEEAAPLLDYSYDTGYGAPDCHAIYVWTKELVIGVDTYDGSTGFFAVPRNPSEVKPDMPGGG